MSAKPENLTKFQPRLFIAQLQFGSGLSTAERGPERPIYAYSHAEAVKVLGRMHFGPRPPAKTERIRVAVKIQGHGWNHLRVDSQGNVFGDYGHPLLVVVKAPVSKDPDLSPEAECMLSLIGRAS